MVESADVFPEQEPNQAFNFADSLRATDIVLGKIPASNYISPTSSLAKKVKQIGNIPIKFPIHPILFMRSTSLNLNASRQLTVEFSDGFPDGGAN
jgi:hypothetical protein